MNDVSDTDLYVESYSLANAEAGLYIISLLV